MLTINDLKIIDIAGREVYHQKINNQSQSNIDISFLNTGIYFLEIISNKRVVENKKIIIAR